MTTSPERSFEDWWKENAPKPPLQPVTIAAVVQRVSLVSIIEQIPKSPFAFAKVADYVVDIKGSPPVVVNSDGSLIISTKLILPAPISIDLVGLGRNTVSSLHAIFSTKDQSLVLDATMDEQPNQPSTKFSISITRPFTVDSYFRAIGYTDTKTPTLAALLTSIVGPTSSSSFFATLPSRLSSLISLPTWPIDPPRSEIQFSLSPFGTDVHSATLMAVVPSSLKVQLAGFTFQIQRLSLSISRLQGSYQAPYDMSMEVDASLSGSGDINLDVLGKVSTPVEGPFRFSLRVSSPSSLANVFKAIAFPSVPNPIPLPLGGPSLPQDTSLSAVGISFIQICTGATSSFQLDEVFFKFDIGSWKPWQYLPSSLQPKKASDVSLNVMVKASPTNVGLQFGYLLNFPETSSSINLQITCWPIQAEKTFTSGMAPFLSVRLDTYEGNPPSIGTVLQKVTNSSWDAVKAAIPILGDLTDAISIVEASLDIGRDSNNNPSITAFSIQAHVDTLTLLSTPSVVVASADLAVSHENGEWKAALRTELLFAERFVCIADLLLPTKNKPGYFRFDNLDQDFTFDELAKSIDSTIDLASVPIIGSDALKTLRLGHITVQVQYIQNVVRLSAFEVELTWARQNIGQVRTAANHLILRWEKLADTQSWSIAWEGQIGANWHLSAGVQYLQDASGVSKKRLVVGGDITNIRGRTPASELVNSLTWTEADSKNTTVWEDTLPSTVYSGFSLDRCSVRMDLGETDIHMVAGQASWGRDGQFSAVLLVEKVSSAWGFTFALAVKNFRFTDIYKDSQLAQLVDTHLTISTAIVLAFRSPNTTKLSAVRQRLSDLGAWERIDQGGTLLAIDPFVDTGVQMGLVFLASMDLGAASSGSLSNNLAVIDSKLASSNIIVSCYLSKAAQTTVTFAAAITSIQLASSLLVKNTKLSFTLPVSGSTSSSRRFELEAECVVQFSETRSWSLIGKSTITESTATLAFSTSGAALLELGALQLKKIELGVAYTFSSAPQPGEDTDTIAPNEGVVKHGTRYGKYVIKLSATIALGSVEGIVYLIFMSGSLGALVITVPGTMNIGVLFQNIFGSGFPAELLDISFSNLLIYYAWNASSKTPAGHQGPSSGTYIKGFHAEAATSIYGIAFDLSVDILTTDKDKEGIQILATKTTPVDVICITLHSKDDTTKGPSFGLFTLDKTCLVEAGISLFGTNLGSIKLTYSNSIPGLRGDVAVRADFLPGGSATVSFELIQKDGKNRLRFVGFPTVFDDIITALQLIENIRELSKADGSPCGAITLAFDKLVKSKISADIKLSDSQRGQSPEEGIPSGVKTISFDVTGRFDISIGGHSITGVDFNPLTFTVEIPKNLDSFGDSLAQFLKDSVSVIIMGLWDNKDKLAEVIALVALKQLTAEAIETLICRNYYKPTPNTLDPPDPEQKPDEVDDGGGPDGDSGSSSSGDGGGSAAGSAATHAGASIATLAGTILGLFGSIPSLVPSKKNPPPPRPPAPGPLNTPPEQDPYAQLIYDALNKDFDRWSKIKDYKPSLRTALECSLEYRDALTLLRKVVTNPSTVAKLGQKQLDDYKLRRANLVYDFSQLRLRFATQWLDMSNESVSVRVVVKDGGKRELEVKWNPLFSDESIVTALTLYINDAAAVELKSYPNNTMTMAAPPFSLQGVRVTAKVVALAATWGGDPKYAFFAQGEPATGTYLELPPTSSILDATKQPQPPEGLNYFHIIDPEKLDHDNEAYPVFRVGAYVYWALNYDDNRSALTIFAYDQDNKLVRTWYKEGARYIWKITVEEENRNVKFIGQGRDSVEFTFDELLAIPIVTTADSNLQPPPPPGLKYITLSDGGSKSYPVVDFPLGYRFWALSFDDNRGSLAIQAYDRNNNLLERVTKIGTRYITRIIVQENQVNFIGQSDDSVVCTTDELYKLSFVPDPSVPLITTADANAQPTPPDGLKYSLLNGDFGSYPVLLYSGLTYWAMSYSDNRVSLCLLGYDAGLNLVKTLSRDGARYISRIILEDSTVYFIGQSDDAVSFTLRELAVQ